MNQRPKQATNADKLRYVYSIGYMRYKLKPNQQKIYDSLLAIIENPKDRKYVMHCSRRFGKTFILVCLAFHVCLANANANVRYASTTGKAVRKMIKPIIRKILKDCPDEFMPSWNNFEQSYQFRNGSELHIAGVNNGHEDDLRGTEADLGIVDEAGYVDNLTYVTDSVIVPQLISTQGVCVLSSSSPITPAHEFAEYIDEAKHKGLYASYTLDDADYDPSTIETFIQEAGGRSSTTCRREYFNELIIDENRQIVPEWSESMVQDIPFDEYYPYYDKYVFMDMGVVDFTAILFAYYDFRKAKLIVIDEVTLEGNQVTTETIREKVLEKEKLYNMTPMKKRVCDNNDLRLVNDLFHVEPEKNLSFTPVTKLASLQAMVNEMRIFIQNGSLVVHPRAKFVIGNLNSGVWNEKRDKFDRTKLYKHFDHLAALMYGTRSVDLTTNPIPITHGHDPKNYWVHPSIQQKKPLIRKWGT